MSSKAELDAVFLDIPASLVSGKSCQWISLLSSTKQAFSGGLGDPLVYCVAF